MQKGDEVIHKITGSKGKIISLGEMAEMCYEVKYFSGEKSGLTSLQFAREITPANTVCTGQKRPASVAPLLL